MDTDHIGLETIVQSMDTFASIGTQNPDTLNALHTVFDIGRKIARTGYKTREDAFKDYGYRNARETILKRQNYHIAIRYMKGHLSDAVMVEEIPPFGKNANRRKLFLKRSYIKAHLNFPWLSFFALADAKYEAAITRENITSKPQNNPSPYPQ